jgi:Tfp pilus assembly protein PilO
VADRRRPVALVLDRWKPLSIALAAIVVANVLVHVFVIRRSVEGSGDREAILRTHRAEVAKAREELVQLERTASKLACVESDVDEVFERMLSSKAERMTAIQRELRQLARDRHLDPEAITYTASEVAGTGLVRFTASFPLTGSYETLRDFIGAVEASSNFLVVQDIGLSGQEGQTLSLDIRLATYFQSPDIDRLKAAFPRVASAT